MSFRFGMRCASAALAFLLALSSPSSVAAQEDGRIQGLVLAGETQQPLAGAQVYIEGTETGTLTGPNGRFLLLNVPAGTHELRVQLIGYATASQSVAVEAGQTATANFELSETALALDEIVVTGTAAEVRYKEVGNSVDAISAREFENLPLANSQDVLAGRAPGVTIMTNSGQPGAGGSVKIRGVTTVSQEMEPLIYVDGIRIYNQVERNGWGGRTGTSPLQDIPAEDIDRIEIVKGAAATTLYGTEASGGVIQIFTKKGIAGEPIWNAEISMGLAQLDNWVDPDVDPTNLFVNCGQQMYGIITDGDDVGQRQYFYDPTCPSDGTWTELGPQQNTALSVRGGVRNVTYYVSGNFSNQEGVLPTQNSKDGGLRGNFGFSPTDDLHLALSTAYVRRNTRWVGDGNNAEGFLLNIGRGWRNYMKGGKGDDCATPPPSPNGIPLVCTTNAYLFNQDLLTKTDHFITGFTVNYDPTESFSNRFAVGWDYLYKSDETTLPFAFLTLPEGYYWDESTWHTKFSLDYAGSFRNNFGEDFVSTFSWGGQIFRDRHRWTEIDVQSFAGPGEPTLESGAQLTYRADAPIAETTAGFFLQELFGWQDRLFLTGGLRVDGSSAFGDNFGLQMYPKLSLAYVLSDYAFWPTDWFETFKLRAAVGESGKAPGTFDKLRTWQSGTGDEDQPGFTPNDIGNDEVGPERTREVEVGFDAALFAGRLGFEATYYHAKTIDALVPVTYPPSEGFLASRIENIGELQNTGWEFQVRGGIITTENIDVRTRLNVSLMDSEVLDLDGDPNVQTDVYTGLNSYIKEGFAFPAYFGNKITNPNEFADPVIEEDAFLGLVYPDQLIGLGATVTLFNNLTLDGLVEYQGGHSVQNYTGYQNARRGVWYPCYEYQEALLNGGDISGFNALTRGRCSIEDYDNFYWVEDADFAKLRQVALSYDLPQAWTPWFASTTLTLAGRNLLTSTDYTGSDPEVQDVTDQIGTGGSDGSFGRRDYYQIPSPRTYLVGLRVSF